MKPGKKLPPPSESSIKRALLGLYGIVGVSVSTFGGFKVPFAESHAKEYWRHALAGIILVLLLIGLQFSSAFAQCQDNAFELLDGNNVSARFQNGGNLFWDMSGNPAYEVPKGGGVSATFLKSPLVPPKNAASAQCSCCAQAR